MPAARRGRRPTAPAALTVFLALLLVLLGVSPAGAVTTGNGALVYSPAAGTSFNPEGGRAAGTTYAKVITLKHNGTGNGTLLATFDQLVLVNGVQVYPIHRSTDGGATWSLAANVRPATQFPALTRTSQPYLYELPQQVGTLPAGTVLLAGMIMPEDRSSSRLVVYTSSDRGTSWSYRSTVDTGGPAVYDPSPTSTTTTVWEPSLLVDGSGGLVCYFSDERQKAGGVLQAVSYRRSTDGGATWGPLVNVSAPPNTADRPGMITVTRLPNGQYMATFEVVNRPSLSQNTAPAYFKLSPDGLNWSPASSIGTPIRLADGRGIGSSPFVRWVPEGGPQGMVVVASKWSLDAAGNIQTGQNFFVNYNLGQGPWERLPYAVTYDSTDSEGGTFSGFAQGFDTSVDGRTLYQAVNVENLATTYNDIRIGTIPLTAATYEAERAVRVDAQLVGHHDASNGSKVGNINNPGSRVTFTVRVPAAATYTINVRYANGTGATSSHAVRVNNGTATSVSYPATANWGRYRWAQLTAALGAGTNTVELAYQGSFAEIDAIQVHRPGATLDPEVRIVNRRSGKLLEILSALTTDGAGAGQYGDTGHPTQVWRTRAVGSGFHELRNKNSDKLLEIPNASTADGTQAVQWGPTAHPTQNWSFTATDSGYWRMTNRNSTKPLEISGNATTDGATAVQNPSSTCLCQQWTLRKEGIQ